MIRRGIDLSNYTGEISEAWAQEWFDAGFDFAIIGTQDPAICRQQLDTLSAAGFECALYIFLYFSSGAIVDQVRAGLSAMNAAADGYGDMRGLVKRVWLDCEDYGVRPPVWVLRGMIFQAIIEVDRYGHQVGIYTGHWWWDSATSSWGWPASHGVPLWCVNASGYDGNTDPLAGWAPVGGWNAPLIKQYGTSGAVDLDGMEDIPNTF